MIDQNSRVESSRIRSAVPGDTPKLIGLADDTGIVRPGEAEALLRNVVDRLHVGGLGIDQQAQVCLNGSSGSTALWAYFGPAVNATGGGIFGGLAFGQFANARLSAVTVSASSKIVSGRLLAGFFIVETSSLPTFESVRRFYRKHQFTECGTIPDFYASGDGKVVFAKPIVAANPD